MAGNCLATIVRRGVTESSGGGNVITSCKSKLELTVSVEKCAVVGGPFAGGGPSVFQRSLSLLVRWVAAWGGEEVGGRCLGRPPDEARCSRCVYLEH